MICWLLSFAFAGLLIFVVQYSSTVTAKQGSKVNFELKCFFIIVTSCQIPSYILFFVGQNRNFKVIFLSFYI